MAVRFVQSRAASKWLAPPLSGAMSVLDTVKSVIGVDDDTRPTYRCQDCGEEFQSNSELGSNWFECPECGSDDATVIEES